MNIIAAIQNTISISQFNRGLAGKIFQDVKNSGAKEHIEKVKRKIRENTLPGHSYK